MLTIKLDTQRFSGGGGTDWTAGVTKSAVETALNSFNKEIEETKSAILAHQKVDSALKAGWSGADCDVFLERFEQHANHVCEQVEEYRADVEREGKSIVDQWEAFQAGLVK